LFVPKAYNYRIKELENENVDETPPFRWCENTGKYNDKDGWWKLKDKENIPLLFSLKAGKV